MVQGESYGTKQRFTEYHVCCIRLTASLSFPHLPRRISMHAHLQLVCWKEADAKVPDVSRLINGGEAETAMIGCGVSEQEGAGGMALHELLRLLMYEPGRGGGKGGGKKVRGERRQHD